MAITSPTQLAQRRAQTLKDFHCSGCGRRLLQYEALGAGSRILVRCRDCKETTELRGADLTALLTGQSDKGGSNGR